MNDADEDCLEVVKEHIEEIEKKKKAVELKLPRGVIYTTCPEKWSNYIKKQR